MVGAATVGAAMKGARHYYQPGSAILPHWVVVGDFAAASKIYLYSLFLLNWSFLKVAMVFYIFTPPWEKILR
jgi:hypothetical protein